MEELLLPPGHSLSSPPLRRNGRKEPRRGREGGTMETRHVSDEKRRQEGKIEE